MSYGVLLTLHLLAAIAFVDKAFFEVVMLKGVRKLLPPETMRTVEGGTDGRHTRARCD